MIFCFKTSTWNEDVSRYVFPFRSLDGHRHRQCDLDALIPRVFWTHYARNHCRSSRRVRSFNKFSYAWLSWILLQQLLQYFLRFQFKIIARVTIAENNTSIIKNWFCFCETIFETDLRFGARFDADGFLAGIQVDRITRYEKTMQVKMLMLLDDFMLVLSFS